MGEHLDNAFESLELAGVSASTIDAIRKLILMSMDGVEFMPVAIVEQLPPIE